MYDPDREGIPAQSRQLVETGGGPLRRYLHFVPYQVDGLPDGRIHRVRRNNGQVDGGIFFSADHFHNLAKFHVDYVHRLFSGLGYFDDAVIGLKSPVQVGRSSGNEFSDGAIAVFLSQNGSYSHQGKTHGNGKVFQGIRGEKGGVGIEHLGQGSQKDFLHVNGFQVLQVFDKTLVASAHRVHRFLILFFIQEVE